MSPELNFKSANAQQLQGFLQKYLKSSLEGFVGAPVNSVWIQSAMQATIDKRLAILKSQGFIQDAFCYIEPEQHGPDTIQVGIEVQPCSPLATLHMEFRLDRGFNVPHKRGQMDFSFVDEELKAAGIF